MIQKILITKDAEIFYIKKADQDYHTKYGFIKKEDLALNGKLVVTNKGKEMFVLDPCFLDCYSKIKRGPQIIPRKDVGVIISNTGIGKDSKVLDAGGGSGALCLFLANICKKVYSYEIREDFFKVLEFNKELLGLKNLSLKNKDVFKGISEKDLDLVVFDLGEPKLAVAKGAEALKVGGFLVNYSPSTPQVSDFVSEVKKIEGMVYLKTIEIMEREWEVEGRKIRPKSRMMGHSGFLSFAKRVNRSLASGSL